MNKIFYQLLLCLYIISCIETQSMDSDNNLQPSFFLINTTDQRQQLESLIKSDQNNYFTEKAKTIFRKLIKNFEKPQQTLTSDEIKNLPNLIYDDSLKEAIESFVKAIEKNNFSDEVTESMKEIINILEKKTELKNYNQEQFDQSLENLYKYIQNNQYNYIRLKTKQNWLQFITILSKLPINVGEMLEQARQIEPFIENDALKNDFTDLCTTIEKNRNDINTIKQKIETINFILNKAPAKKTPAQTAETAIDKLIRQAYFSPEMHYYLRKGISKTWDFQLNVVTGQCTNLPTISQIINATTPDLQAKIQMLEIALQAAHLALFIAALNTFYEHEENLTIFAPNYSTPISRSAYNLVPSLFSESIDFLMPNIEKEALNQITRHITNLKQQISLLQGGWTGYIGSKISDTVSSIGSYVKSWVPFINQEKLFQPTDSTETMPTKNKLALRLDFENLENEENIQPISENMLKGIIFNNNYNQRKTYKEKADLLFQQCLIAQNDDLAVQQKAIPFRLTQTEYLYGVHLNADTLLDTMEKLIGYDINNGQRDVQSLKDLIQTTDANLKQTNKLEPAQAYQLLQKIHKAVQTAIYINNINSWTGYIVPPKYRSIFDSVIQQLLFYDQRINTMCKLPFFNLNHQQAIKRENWANFYTYAALLGTGIALTGAITTNYLYPDNPVAQTPIAGIPLQVSNKLIDNAGNMTIDVLKSADRAIKEYFELVPSRNFIENPKLKPLKPVTIPKTLPYPIDNNFTVSLNNIDKNAV